VTKSAATRRKRHAIFLVDDEPALGETIEAHLTESAMEVVPVHDSIVALGVLEARPAIGLLMTKVATENGTSRCVALMVQRLVQGVGFVFMTGRPQLLGAPGEIRDKASVTPVDLADLPQEIRHRLTE
jgi:DNA-binding NtrC family response regulator